MIKGKIIRQISNQYQVYVDDNTILDCVAMGKLRLKQSPKVGDHVLIKQFENQVGIEEILTRKNDLIRPNIANVDQVIILMSSVEPNFSHKLLDRLISMIEYHNIIPVIVITKMDLINYDLLKNEIEKYQKLGYQVFTTSINDSTDQFEKILENKVSVLTGNSGVGKSSLLNRINPEFKIKTQSTSKALGRGKHTTRHCELFKINNGWIADTPGFSSLSFATYDESRIKDTFIEFKNYECRFMDCLHKNEPNCGVKNAVENNDIYKTRYDNYIEILDLIKEEKKK